MFIIYSQPTHDIATNTEWQLAEAVLIQSVSPDDERDMLETCRELYINKYIEKNLWVKLVNYQESIQIIFRDVIDVSCYIKCNSSAYTPNLPCFIPEGQDLGMASEVLTFLLCLITIIEVFKTLFYQIRTTEICIYFGNPNVLIYLVTV